MTLTYNVLSKSNARGSRINLVEITYDNSYTTGGLALSANNCGLNTITSLVAGPVSSAGYIPSYDRTTGKLLALFGDNTNAASAPLIQVTNATDLSAVKAILIVFGT